MVRLARVDPERVDRPRCPRTEGRGKLPEREGGDQTTSRRFSVLVPTTWRWPVAPSPPAPSPPAPSPFRPVVNPAQNRTDWKANVHRAHNPSLTIAIHSLTCRYFACSTWTIDAADGDTIPSFAPNPPITEHHSSPSLPPPINIPASLAASADPQPQTSYPATAATIASIARRLITPCSLLGSFGATSQPYPIRRLKRTTLHPLHTPNTAASTP